MPQRIRTHRHDSRAQTFAMVCAGVTILLAIAGCQNGGTRLLAPLQEANTRREIERADQLISEKQANEAAAILDDIVRKDPNNHAVHARLGRIRFDSGDYATAAQHYRAALRVEPSCFHYALALAQCQSRLAATSMDRDKTMDAAARAYQYAQSLDPQSFAATIQLAACYREQGAFDKACKALQDAGKLYPNAAVIHTQLGEVFLAQIQCDAAMREFKAALKIEPTNLAAHNGCGAVNAALSQAGGAKGAMARERAIAHYRRSLQIDDKQPGIRNALQDLEPYQWKTVTVTEDSPQ